ncbi:hypothetical protein BDW_11685 [Bdellovibrio bacteriovorus W]|nr:hypothetical protein BDW_11685 [Bdellovibrio bacteriovorus W]
MFHNKGAISLFLAIAVVGSLLPQTAEAQRRFVPRASTGDISLGIAIATVSAGQDDMNSAIDAAAATGASTKNLGNAWEIMGSWNYRFSGTMYSFVFRPSYFFQKQDGSGPGGSYDYGLSGFTVFPIFRVTPLENSFIKFYMQTGLGYGTLNGEITAGAHDLKFKGSAFGVMGGIGVDFCFSDAHCLTVEGNLRYMPIERNLTTGGNCTNGSIPDVTQCGGSSEVELRNSDLRTTFSGVQGVVGYTMNF